MPERTLLFEYNLSRSYFHNPALQEVYGKLEEPDGLAGLVRLRQGGATPADHMLAAEKAGAWSEALSLHEQVPFGSLRAEAAVSGRRIEHVLVIGLAMIGCSCKRSAALTIAKFRRRAALPAQARCSKSVNCPSPGGTVPNPCPRLLQALQRDAVRPRGAAAEDAETAAAAGAPGGDQGLSAGQRGYLRCLQHMGHLHSQLTHVNGWAHDATGAAPFRGVPSRRCSVVACLQLWKAIVLVTPGCGSGEVCQLTHVCGQMPLPNDAAK